LSQGRHFLLFTHAASLYSFLALPASESGLSAFKATFLRAYRGNAIEDGLGLWRILRLAAPPVSIRIARASDQRVLGAMNGMKQFCRCFPTDGGPGDARWIRMVNGILNHVPLEMKDCRKPLEEIRKF
jgi:hypothetical protein